MKTEYTREQLETINAICFLRGVKEGDIVSKRMIESLRTLHGEVFDALGEPKKLFTIDLEGVEIPHADSEE